MLFIVNFCCDKGNNLPVTEVKTYRIVDYIPDMFVITIFGLYTIDAQSMCGFAEHIIN